MHRPTRGNRGYQPAQDGYSLLALAVIRQAVRDARAGDREALAWLECEYIEPWLDLAGIQPTACYKASWRDVV